MIAARVLRAGERALAEHTHGDAPNECRNESATPGSMSMAHACRETALSTKDDNDDGGEAGTRESVFIRIGASDGPGMTRPLRGPSLFSNVRVFVKGQVASDPHTHLGEIWRHLLQRASRIFTSTSLPKA